MTYKKGFATLAVHAGETPDKITGASSPNLVMSSTYVTDPDVSFSAEDFGENTPYIYTRWGNPTITQLEQKLAELEGAEAAIAFASGMAASTGLLLQFLKPGDHLVMSDVSYAGVAEFAKDYLPARGIEVSRVDLSQPENLRQALRPTTRLVYAETPANPILKLTDIAAVAAIAHAAGARLIVDSTFATPVATRPLELGADFVVHSLTKYIGGHGDAIGGAVLGKVADLAVLRKEVGIHLGGIISPFNAWLIMRGLATLPLRMRAHEENALSVARWLEDHPRVARVIYPGLASHPQAELARRQMKNFSGMISFQVKGAGEILARTFAERLEVIHYAVSLGHHRSLIFYLATQDMLRTSFTLTSAQEATYREFAGDGIFRFSVGLEDAADLIRDLEVALA
ncbi:aminotransferase class I/II-fold pyridoxal phosphate-dependent enzyme [Rhodocyclus tenuis]|uniref:Aminotransferase class I/II-fold pyridoxal phosphate-dependent enzyme n=1 Tax=Rhodocyclus gracilis TaxID=2929842 RepID=A0ABX0WFI9_9RHOO|nr:aminotransferase class I/II-fold pyridoxal phosphate-dependent enzyme [Rhodocyclus gracilis]NJA87646.1 aminotransferase class I/II-fold pyridoxal phosphate-dependent enzyme [Rhodocyclus gracilis]